MAAKRRWAAWVHSLVGMTIVIEMAFVVLAMLFLIPKCQAIIIDADVRHVGPNAFMPGAAAIFAFLYAAKHYFLVWVVPLPIGWGLFEWRGRRESKSDIRLSAMAFLMLILLIVIGMVSAVMTIPTARAAEQSAARQPELIVRDRMATIDRLTSELDRTMAAADWPAFVELSHTASGQAGDLAVTGAAAPALITLNQQTQVEEVRGQISDARGYLIDAWMAARKPDPARVQLDMQRFHAVYEQIHRRASMGSQ